MPARMTINHSRVHSVWVSTNLRTGLYVHIDSTVWVSMPARMTSMIKIYMECLGVHGWGVWTVHTHLFFICLGVHASQDDYQYKDTRNVVSGCPWMWGYGLYIHINSLTVWMSIPARMTINHSRVHSVWVSTNLRTGLYVHIDSTVWVSMPARMTINDKDIYGV